MRAALVASVVLLLLAPATAGAAPRTPAAQGFADALLHARKTIKAKLPDVLRQIDERDDPPCPDIVDSVPEDLVLDRIQLELVWSFQPQTDLIIEVSRQIVGDLAGVETRDPVLRSGRAAWRTGLKLTESYPRVDDVCAQLAAWRDADWKKSAAPPYLRFDSDAVERRATRNDRKLDAAARRLRQLGVSRRVAEFFKGAALLDDPPG